MKIPTFDIDFIFKHPSWHNLTLSIFLFWITFSLKLDYFIEYSVILGVTNTSLWYLIPHTASIEETPYYVGLTAN